MKPEQYQELRKAFPPALIGKLPKAGIKLDYVGHAAVTDRLNEVDPSWTWTPMGFAPEGTPAIVKEGQEAFLWIYLTVCGVTRPGVGSERASSADLHKKLVSDALRNAAMRFGVAVDLWSKEELDGDKSEPDKAVRTAVESKLPTTATKPTGPPPIPGVKSAARVCADCGHAIGNDPVVKRGPKYFHEPCAPGANSSGKVGKRVDTLDQAQEAISKAFTTKSGEKPVEYGDGEEPF